jgi:hypothetical protein
VGIGFAVQIVQSGREQRGRIGVSIRDLSAEERKGRIEGAVIDRQEKRRSEIIRNGVTSS